MPSAIWTGSISFGLVTVPVRLVSATKSLDVRFNQLDADTGARIRYRRVSDATGEEVPSEKIVKGYEIEPGQYVIVEPDELAALQPKKSRAIEIITKSRFSCSSLLFDSIYLAKRLLKYLTSSTAHRSNSR